MSRISICKDAVGLKKYLENESRPNRYISEDQWVILKQNNMRPIVAMTGEKSHSRLVSILGSLSETNDRTIRHILPGLYFKYLGRIRWSSELSRMSKFVCYPFQEIQIKDVEMYKAPTVIVDQFDVFECPDNEFVNKVLTKKMPTKIELTKMDSVIIKNGKSTKIIPRRHDEIGRSVKSFNTILKSVPEQPVNGRDSYCFKCGIYQFGKTALNENQRHIVCMYCANDIAGSVVLPSKSQRESYQLAFPEHYEVMDKLFSPETFDNFSYKSPCRFFQRFGEIMLCNLGLSYNCNFWWLLDDEDLIVELKKSKVFISRIRFQF